MQNKEIKLYESILNYLTAPDCYDCQTIIGCAPTEIKENLQEQLNEAMCLFATEKVLYTAHYTYGQNIIWNEVLKTYRILDQQKCIIEKVALSPDISNYDIAMREVKKVLYPYSRMQIALSDLEETLGRLQAYYI